MRVTTYWEELVASLADIIVIGVITLLLHSKFASIPWQIIAIVTFFLYSLLFLMTPSKRDLGMFVVKSYWKEPYSLQAFVIYTVLYTLSFSTLFVQILFPFDILILNLIAQAIVIRYTGTTIHGYLAGNITTVKKRRQKT